MKRLSLVLLAAFVLFESNAFAQSQNPALASEDKILKAHPLPLEDVRLTGGPLKHAQDLECRVPARARARPHAGLSAPARQAWSRRRKGYGGWDGDGRQLTGHIAGHYLSAVSLHVRRHRRRALQGTRRLHRQRAEDVIQDAQGDGYIGALMDGNAASTARSAFSRLAKGIIRSGGFDLNGMWSPWYVEHKIFAGLRDAYRYTGNRTALDVEIKFAAWAESILGAAQR